MTADRFAVFIRTANGLMPHNEAASEALRGVAYGTKIRAQISRPRNLAAHNLFWALCSKIADAVPGDYTAENIADVLKIRTGHCTVVQTKHGLVQLPKSISFAAMDNAAFSSFLDRCIKIICEEFLGNLPPSALRAELSDMLEAA